MGRWVPVMPMPAGAQVHNILSLINRLWTQPNNNPITTPYDYSTQDFPNVVSMVTPAASAPEVLPLTPVKTAQAFDLILGGNIPQGSFHWWSYQVVENQKVIGNLQTRGRFQPRELASNGTSNVDSQPSVVPLLGAINTRANFGSQILSAENVLLMYWYSLRAVWGHPASRPITEVFTEGQTHSLPSPDHSMEFNIRVPNGASRRRFTLGDFAEGVLALLAEAAKRDSWNVMQGIIKKGDGFVASVGYDRPSAS